MNTLGCLDDATLAAALGVYELDLELDRKARLWLRLAEARAPLTAADPDNGVAWPTWAAARLRARGLCELCGNKTPVLQREHVLSRLGLRNFLGLRWEAVHSPAVIAAACRDCNVKKGTLSLSPDDLRWLWQYAGFKVSQAERDFYLFAATVIEQKSWVGLPIRQTVEADMARIPGPKLSLGALLRRQGLATAADVLATTIEDIWADELASDDNREMWGTASWQTGRGRCGGA